MIDNTTAVARSITRLQVQATVIKPINNLAVDISQFCIKYESTNVKSQDKEWILNPKLLTAAFETFKFTQKLTCLPHISTNNFHNIAHKGVILTQNLYMHLLCPGAT